MANTQHRLGHNYSGLAAADSSYFQAGDINNSTIHHHHPSSNKKDANQCLRDLFLTDPTVDKQAIRAQKDSLLEGSCRWLCDSPAFTQWRDNTESRTLWIHGDPGKGKTMIMMALTDELESRVAALRNLVEHLGAPQSSSEISELPVRLETLELMGEEESMKRPDAVAYFFCQSTDSKTNTATAILRGLIYMLIKQQDSLVGHLQKRYDDAGPQMFEGSRVLYTLWSVLSDMIADRSLGTTYLVVDALDECNSELNQLLDLITKNESGVFRKVKWLLSSRNWPSIQRRFEYGDCKQHVSLELNAAHVSHAVTTFIHTRVDELVTQKVIGSKLKELVYEYLVGHADDTFLWVAVVCKSLRQQELLTERKLRQVLESFPTGLEPLYDRMLEDVEGVNDEETREHCRAVLRAATIARRPLEIQELSFVAALPDEDFDDLEVLRKVVQLCGSFLTLRDNVVYFVHQSAKDYFDAGLGQRIFTLGGQALEHEQLSCRCLHLMACTLKEDVCNLRLPGTPVWEVKETVINEHIPADVQYACLFWISHLEQAGVSLDCQSIFRDSGPVHTFFQRTILYWLEALSLLDTIPEGLSGLIQLDQIIQSSKGGGIVGAMIADSVQFLDTFRTVIENTPLQIYSSALIFSPRESIVRQNFERLIPSWIVIKPRVENTWTASLDTLEGHSDCVSSVVCSPDGKLLASASDDSTARIWDATTGAPLYTLEGHSDWVRSVIFSPDGKLLASASDDRTAKIWDATTGAPLYTLEGHSDWVESVVFSPDGKLLASASYDSMMRIWSVETGKQLNCVDNVDTSWFPLSRLADQTFRMHGFISKPEHDIVHCDDQTQNRYFSVDAWNQWITFGEANLLWLPHNIRSHSSDAYCANDNTIMLGSYAGRMTLLRFDQRRIPVD